MLAMAQQEAAVAKAREQQLAAEQRRLRALAQLELQRRAGPDGELLAPFPIRDGYGDVRVESVRPTAATAPRDRDERTIAALDLAAFLREGGSHGAD